MIEGFLLLCYLIYCLISGWKAGCEEAVQDAMFEKHREEHGTSHPDDPTAFMDPIRARLANEMAAREAEGQGASRRAKLHRRQNFEVMQGGASPAVPFSLDDEGDPFEDEDEA